MATAPVVTVAEAKSEAASPEELKPPLIGRAENSRPDCEVKGAAERPAGGFSLIPFVARPTRRRSRSPPPRSGAPRSRSASRLARSPPASPCRRRRRRLGRLHEGAAGPVLVSRDQRDRRNLAETVKALKARLQRDRCRQTRRYSRIAQERGRTEERPRRRA